MIGEQTALFQPKSLRVFLVIFDQQASSVSFDVNMGDAQPRFYGMCRRSRWLLRGDALAQVHLVFDF